ncbi:MAG: hypothetical protein J6A01_06130 [Proteobacteria bacterium]|nr:hypothetical protein [Pseudomonadota bacterium]
MRSNRLLGLFCLYSALTLGCTDSGVQNEQIDQGPEDTDTGVPLDDPDLDDDDPDPKGEVGIPGPDEPSTPEDKDSMGEEIIDEEEDSEPEQICDEICQVGSYRCNDGGSQICELVDDCPAWGTVKACEKCNESTGECLECQNSCTEGAIKCENRAVWTCVVGDNTCTEWEQTKSCGEDEICKDSECVFGCEDECQKDETRCADGAMQKCTKNSSGCMVWKKDKACGKAKSCSADGTKCEYACGSDCDPFSIVIIPDTQGYTWSSRMGRNDPQDIYKTAKGEIITEENSLRQ